VTSETVARMETLAWRKMHGGLPVYMMWSGAPGRIGQSAGFVTEAQAKFHLRGVEQRDRGWELVRIEIATTMRDCGSGAQAEECSECQGVGVPPHTNLADPDAFPCPYCEGSGTLEGKGSVAQGPEEHEMYIGYRRRGGYGSSPYYWAECSCGWMDAAGHDDEQEAEMAWQDHEEETRTS
jgi:hypothetical protein